MGIVMLTPPTYFLFLSSHFTNILAKIVPEMECHTHETADTIAASGNAAKCFDARLVASPAFCIPTSIAMVRFFATPIFKALPTKNPNTYPNAL